MQINNQTVSQADGYSGDEQHVSSVPDQEFPRPRTIEELKEYAYLAADIAHNVRQYIIHSVQGDHWKDAEDIVAKAQNNLTETFSWTVRMMYQLRPGLEKEAA